MLLIVTSFWS